MITGSPCAGKTTLAAKLAKSLGVPCISVNEFAISRGYYRKERGVAEKVVDLRRTSAALRKHLSKLGGFVVEGHLACEFALPCDAVLVLRANPLLLSRRYGRRGYSQEKSDENLLAEILDYCLCACEGNYPKAKIAQADNSRPRSVASFTRLLSRRGFEKVNWSKALVSRRFSGLVARAQSSSHSKNV